MDHIDCKNAQYHRTLVTKRLAVKTIIEIAELVMPHGTISLISWDYKSWNYGLDEMVRKIARLKVDSEKYHQLRNLLKETVK